MAWQQDLLGLLAGFVLAAVATPVGVSGAVFLLPVQLSVLGVPNPQVTPTNLMYNVISGPGALVAFLRQHRLGGRLTRLLELLDAAGRHRAGDIAGEGLAFINGDRLTLAGRGRALVDPIAAELI